MIGAKEVHKIVKFGPAPGPWGGKELASAGFPEGLTRPAVYGWGVRSPKALSPLERASHSEASANVGFVIDYSGN